MKMTVKKLLVGLMVFLSVGCADVESEFNEPVDQDETVELGKSEQALSYVDESLTRFTGGGYTYRVGDTVNVNKDFRVEMPALSTRNGYPTLNEYTARNPNALQLTFRGAVPKVRDDCGYNLTVTLCPYLEDPFTFGSCWQWVITQSWQTVSMPLYPEGSWAPMKWGINSNRTNRYLRVWIQMRYAPLGGTCTTGAPFLNPTFIPGPDITLNYTRGWAYDWSNGI
jgi:hypothetical protein